MSGDLDHIALDTATAILKMYFEPIPGVQLKAKIQEAVRDAMGRAEQPSNPVPHGHRDDYYLMANGRRLAGMPVAKVRDMPNWVLASELFATGSTSAFLICRDAGIDPYSTTVERIVGQQTKGGGNGD